MGRHKDRSINVNNKKPYKKYTLPDQEEIDRLINKSTVLNTKRATTAWLNKFENFRSNVKYIGKCTEVADIHELEVQIQNFIVVMKTKYGEDYKATSINACIDALNRHLNQYSVIRPLDLKDRRMFPSLWQILDGKLKDITEQGKGEIKGSDSLSLDEVKLMFNSPILSTDTPTGLLKTVFFYNALFLGLRGGEHYIL
ncbi:hypothetical protein RhiirC2_835244, partial [Rhizophagus irregularis]